MKYRINYSKVIQQANLISDNADQLNDQITRLNQLEQECRACWKGETAEIFILRLNQLRNEMTRTKTQMVNLSSTIKYCADRIQREDRDAERRAIALKSGN